MKRTKSMNYKESVESRELFLYAVNDTEAYYRDDAVFYNLSN